MNQHQLRFLVRIIPLLTCIGTCLMFIGESRAQEAPFAEDPIPFGDNATKYRAILRDIDLDGDLDLTVRNWGSSSPDSYYNSGEPNYFGQIPVGFLPPIRGHSFTMGDVDNDGYPDIVTGGGSQGAGTSGPNELWLNENGEYQSTPAWVSVSPSENFTAAIQLADVDADGDLDLVCGNGHQYTGSGYANTVYLNEGGGFDTAPSWISESHVNNTQAVAVGDLDRDGLLDVIFGNAIGPSSTRNTMYLNVGSPDLFGQSPDWIEMVTGEVTVKVLLGDVDRDGDLDLFSVNRSNVRLYLNEYNLGLPGVFPNTSVWINEIPVNASSADLGDVNGDGWLDLVIADLESDNLLFLNQGLPEFFAGVPSWEFEADKRTAEVCLGDVDGDGDLDLVCANDVAPNSLYLNQAPVLTGEPAQPMILPNATWDVALADLDGDGLLDLICGNEGQSRAYLNTPTWPDIYLPAPQWSSQFSVATRAVALGDVNGDGELDLALGNSGDFNWVFINDGGNLPTVPSWFSDEAAQTMAVRLADLDGDGDPDLISGNRAGPNLIHFNQAGSLETFSRWQTGLANDTRDLALGDVNGDGHLDLICGNDGQANTLYQGDGSVFTVAPVWQAEQANNTWSVALGDLDSDGDLDLVCGNNGQPNMLYRNYRGELGRDPAWVSDEADSTTSVNLADVDGDGDLDLICGNTSGLENLYLNVGGQLGQSAHWQSHTTQHTTSIVSGDLDRDGDLDLVVGNLAEKNSIHLGRRNPILTFDPLSPLGHLANNPTYLEAVNVTVSGDNRYSIQWHALDVESDPYWLLLRYRYEDARHGTGQPQWLPIENASPLGPFMAAPLGVDETWEWDVSLLPRDTRKVTLHLQVLDNPRSVSHVQQVPFHQVDLGPLAISRPEIQVSSSVVFPVVTVGDTVSSEFTLTNTGNEELVVSELIVPSTEMWLAGDTQFTVPAGTAHLCTLVMAPCDELEFAGSVEIISNAPLSPMVSIPVQSQVLTLDVRTRLLNPEEEVPLGEALTVIVSPEAGVKVEGGHLFHRPSGSTPAFRDSIPLAESGDDFIAVIPGEAVTEAGLDYYVKVVNGCVFATDPPGAPADSLYVQPVAPPSSVLATPQTTSGADFLQGREITVLVSLPPGAEFQQGTLYIRPGGESTYMPQPLQESEPLPVGVVPDSLVGPRGLEFWVEVQTQTSVLTDPPTDPSTSPNTIRVHVTDLVEPGIHAGLQYRMVSVPLDFGGDFTGTLESLLSNQSAFGPYPAEPYEQGQWRCFRGFAPEGIYLELPAGAPEDFRVQPGRAFWLISRDENWIATSPVAGTSTATDGEYEITLAPGWNQIGHPFSFPVDWNEVLVDGQAPDPSTVEGPWLYDGTPYIPATVLVPFAGYWVLNKVDPPRDLILAVPPRESTANKEKTGEDDLVSDAVSGADTDPGAAISWQLTVIASCAGVQDGSNRLGAASTASDQWDRHDRREPPPAPVRSLSLYFPHTDWEQAAGLYTVDLQQASGGGENGGHRWSFDVAKNFTAAGVADEVQLEFEGVDDLVANPAPDQTAVLLDRELLTTVDLRSETGYTFFLGRRDPVADPSDARFLLLVGTDDYITEQANELSDIPLQTTLLPNRPNPFNPATVIRYELAQAGRASLRVYDVSGALIRTLRDDHHPVGRHEVAWRSEDERGRQVAAGVYFYRLETAKGHRETRKMLLVK